MLTQKRLKECLDYNPNAGIFSWFGTGKGKKDYCGNKSMAGYLRIMIDGKSYQAHRLAFLYVYGYLPCGEVDHIDHNRMNNSIHNLRIVNHSENSKNQSMRNTNTSGVMGVIWDKSRNMWQARIHINGKGKLLGRYKEKSNAILARKAAEIECGYHKNHGAI